MENILSTEINLRGRRKNSIDDLQYGPPKSTLQNLQYKIQKLQLCSPQWLSVRIILKTNKWLLYYTPNLTLLIRQSSILLEFNFCALRKQNQKLNRQAGAPRAGSSCKTARPAPSRQNVLSVQRAQRRVCFFNGTPRATWTDCAKLYICFQCWFWNLSNPLSIKYQLGGIILRTSIF